MAKGGAATGKKRERFEKHKVDKAVRQQEKIRNVQAHGRAGRPAAEGAASSKAAAAPRGDGDAVSFAVARPFLEAAPLECLRFFASAPASQSRPPAGDEAATAAEADDAGEAAVAARRRERRELMSQLKKRVPRSGVVPRRVAEWILSSGRAWAPTPEESDRTLGYAWRLPGLADLDLPDRTCRWMEDDAVEAIASVERAATPAGPAVRLVGDAGSRMDLVLERDFHGAIRVSGVARRTPDAPPRAVASEPIEAAAV